MTVVTLVATLTNPESSNATGVQVTSLLPPELSFVTALTNLGTYDDATGLWDVGTLLHGYQAQLSIQATVLDTAAGQTVTSTTSITAADQDDPNAGNNTSSQRLTVPYADLALGLASDIPIPLAGDTVQLTLTVENLGPDDLDTAAISFPLPTGLTLANSSPSQGTWNGETAVWDFASLASGGSATLTQTVTVEEVAAGSTISLGALVVGSDPVDANAGNSTTSLDFHVPGTDLDLSLTVNQAAAAVAEEVTYTLNVHNSGSQDAAGIVTTLSFPAGLDVSDVTPGTGSYADATGEWILPTLAAPGTATLQIRARPHTGTTGQTLSLGAEITNQNPADPVADNNAAAADLLVLGSGAANDILIWTVGGSGRTVHPDAPENQPVLEMAFWNRGSSAKLLDGLILTNLTEASGTQDEIDAAWSRLAIQRDGDATTLVEASPAGSSDSPFGSGSHTFAGLGWSIPANDTLRVTALGAASAHAPDGTRLRAGIHEALDMTITGDFTMAGTFPLTSGHSLLVDGFTTDQATIQPLEAALLPIGSQDQLVLTLDLPANGYLADHLLGLSLVDTGTALPGQDIAALKIWAETTGDGFDTDDDTYLGTTVFSGDRYNLTGLRLPIPEAGQRIYATVNISEVAGPTRNIRLGVPGGDAGFGVEMQSGNDGPVDGNLINPVTMGISVTDRIIVTPEWSASEVVLPGDDDIVLLQVLLTNTYTESHPLERLDFTNTSTADNLSPDQLDAMFHQLSLRLDQGNPGRLDGPEVDPVLATGSFADLAASFTGLNLDLAPGSATRLFITADLGLHTVPVGALLSGRIDLPRNLDIPEATIIARWPVTSGAILETDGMATNQITFHELPVLTLGPDEGPVLALDLELPGNGPLTDILEGIHFRNEGTARSVDIADARFWADGGNGFFDAAGGDDQEVCTLTINGDDWASPILDHPLAAGTNRFFVSLKVASSPADSVTVQLGLARNAVTVTSLNDGPLNAALPGEGTLVISTSPLRTRLTFASHATCSGQDGLLTMSVVNAGSETVMGITPNLEFIHGEELMDLGDPQPAQIDNLEPGEERIITWDTHSQFPGSVMISGHAAGTVGSGQDRFSVETSSSHHQVYSPVPDLELYPTANLPFSVNQGQENLVPFTLTLINPGGDDVADARLSGLKLRLLESETGPGIVPADLLARAVVHEGTEIYLTETNMPTSGDILDLDFDQPVTITGIEPVTLNLRLDLKESSAVGSFLVSLEQADWFISSNAISGEAVDIVLSDDTFPVLTGQATLVAPAHGLALAVQNPAESYGVPGQQNVLLAQYGLTQTLQTEGASPIDVGRLGLVLRDADGVAIANPGTYIRQMIVHSSHQEHFHDQVHVEADTLLSLPLTTPITVATGSGRVLYVRVDLAATAPLDRLTAVLIPDAIDARDGNMNNPVPVSLTTTAAAGPLVIVGPAADLTLTPVGLMPATISRGIRDLEIFRLDLFNPGDANTAPVTCDQLSLNLVDDQRLALDPLPYFERVDVKMDGTLVGTLLDPQNELGRMAIDLAGVVLPAGQSVQLTITADVPANCPSGQLEAILMNDPLVCHDTYTLSGVAVQAADGTPLPATSGAGNIVDVADELRVSAASLMPPLIAHQEEPFPVLSLLLENPANIGSGGIALSGISLSPGAAKSGSVSYAAVLDSVMLVLDGVTIATCREFEPGPSFVLEPATRLVLEANTTLDLRVLAAIRENAPAGELRFVLSEDGVQVTAPGGEGLVIKVLPHNGHVFPMESEMGNISGSDLAASYANFPNPFAAGREATTFAYTLNQQGTVRLRILTPHGEVVRELLDDVIRGPGLHQDDLWNGRNGRGRAVYNGVYIAELTVTFDDGSTQRHLRKVAVVR